MADTVSNIKYLITSKTGVGSYHYDVAGSNRLSRIVDGGTTTTFAYDNNGNITGDGDRSLLYTTFDKPHTITDVGGDTLTFSYGANRSRYQRTINGETTWYVGNVEITEAETDGNTVTAWVFTRYVDDKAIVQVKQSGSNRTTNSTRYPLRDHLGSLDILLDEHGYDASGQPLNEQDLSFAAFGLRRNSSDWISPIDMTSGRFARLLETTRRGYTSHEMLDAVGLIHMNGRVYDPNIGRFLSADPFVQAPAYTQSYNRYAYAFNNPMAYTDPSGYFLDKAFRKINKALGGLAPYVAIALPLCNHNWPLEPGKRSAPALYPAVSPPVACAVR